MKNAIVYLSVIFFYLSINAEAQDFKTGLKFDDAAYDKIEITPLLAKGDYDLPAEASLQKYCPEPGMQGGYATSVGWAVAYGARTIIHAIQNNLSKDEIKKNVFSPSYIYNQVKNEVDSTCQDGVSLRQALELMQNEGVAKLSDFSYQCSSEVPADVKQKASEFKIKDFVRLFYTSSPQETKVNTIKKAIHEKHPVIVGINTPKSFFNVKSEQWIPDANENPAVIYGGQSMVVIGYDDDKYGGAFRLLNSWGLFWGDMGYIWISYSDFSNFCRYAYELVEIPSKKIELSGELQFRLISEELMEANFDDKERSVAGYKMRLSYRSGVKFRFNVQSNNAAYVYVLASDLSGSVVKIFPYKPSICAYMGYSENSLVIPSEKSYIKMDDTPGTDFLCVFYSKNKLNIDDLIVEMNKNKALSFNEKISSVFINLLVPANNIEYSSTTISFNTKLSDDKNSVVPLLIEIEHE